MCVNLNLGIDLRVYDFGNSIVLDVYGARLSWLVFS